MRKVEGEQGERGEEGEEGEDGEGEISHRKLTSMSRSSSTSLLTFFSQLFIHMYCVSLLPFQKSQKLHFGQP